MRLVNPLHVLAFATTAHSVSNQLIKNYCPAAKYITVYLNETGLEGPFALPSGQAYLTQINGTGNQITLTNEAAPFGALVPRFTLGTSTDNGIVYWAISHLSGDPMTNIPFNVTSANPLTPDVCQHVTGYDGKVHACPDNDVTLTLNVCSMNQ